MLLRLEPSGGYVSTDEIINLKVEGSKVVVQYKSPNQTTINCSSPERAQETADNIAIAHNSERRSDP